MSWCCICVLKCIHNGRCVSVTQSTLTTFSEYIKTCVPICVVWCGVCSTGSFNIKQRQPQAVPGLKTNKDHCGPYIASCLGQTGLCQHGLIQTMHTQCRQTFCILFFIQNSIFFFLTIELCYLLPVESVHEFPVFTETM